MLFVIIYFMFTRLPHIYATDSSKIRLVLSMINLQNELILDIEVSVEASEGDQSIFGPNTIARLPDVIRLADEWSTTW